MDIEKGIKIEILGERKLCDDLKHIVWPGIRSDE
jgi:hypothetical protein